MNRHSIDYCLNLSIHYGISRTKKEEIMKKSLISILASIAVLTTFSLPVSTVVAADFISIGTGGPTGVYFVVGNSVCRMVHKEAAEGRKEGRKHGIRCAAPSTGGSNYNIGQIKEGELQFGVAQSDWQYHAVNGSSKWEGNQFKNLRAVFSVHPEPVSYTHLTLPTKA